MVPLLFRHPTGTTLKDRIARSLCVSIDFVFAISNCFTLIIFVCTRTARLYYCQRCHQQVVLCSSCDRGNIYCFSGCAATARREKCQQANQRYRSSYRGRRYAAQRQADWRQRRREEKLSVAKKVTHQGIDAGVADDVLPATSDTALCMQKADAPLLCHGCGQRVSRFLRREWIRYPRVVEVSSLLE